MGSSAVDRHGRLARSVLAFVESSVVKVEVVCG
jgi:hypothetical protein